MAAPAYSWLNDCSDEPTFLEDSSEGEGPAWEDDEELEFDVGQEEAGRLLTEYLIELRHKATLSHKQVCLISWWAYKAGAQGPVSTLAFRPQAPSGHYARHLQTALNPKGNDGRSYAMEAPGFKKFSASRDIVKLEVEPLHESLAEEIAYDDGLREENVRHHKELLFPPVFLFQSDCSCCNARGSSCSVCRVYGRTALQ